MRVGISLSLFRDAELNRLLQRLVSLEERKKGVVVVISLKLGCWRRGQQTFSAHLKGAFIFS